MPTRTRATRPSGSVSSCSIGTAPEGHGTTVLQEERPAPSRMLPSVTDRIVRFRVRTILAILGLVIAVWVVAPRPLGRAARARLAPDRALPRARDQPARRVCCSGAASRRGLAAGSRSCSCSLGVAGVAALFVPTLVDNVNNFVDAVPDYVDDLTKGRGRFGFLETKYHVVEKVREQMKNGGAKSLLGCPARRVSITKGVVNIVVGTLTIVFMTFFMLLEGPVWIERFYGLLSPESQPRWRSVGHDIYRHGRRLRHRQPRDQPDRRHARRRSCCSILGVPYAVALGLIVALLDLIPLAGATIAAIIIGAVAFLHSIVARRSSSSSSSSSTSSSRTTSSSRSSTTARSQLSPLAILVSVLIGAQIAGVLGALAAIPVAGAIQVLVLDFLRAHRERKAKPAVT